MAIDEPGEIRPATARAMADFGPGFSPDFTWNPGSSALRPTTAAAPPCTFRTRPLVASASMSRRTVMSETPRVPTSSETRTPPMRSTSRRITSCRCRASTQSPLISVRSHRVKGCGPGVNHLAHPSPAHRTSHRHVVEPSPLKPNKTKHDSPIVIIRHCRMPAEAREKPLNEVASAIKTTQNVIIYVLNCLRFGPTFFDTRRIRPGHSLCGGLMNATPDPLASMNSVSRRTILQAVAAGAVTIPLLAACTGQTKTTASSGGTAATKTVTFGSNASDAVPKAAMAALMAAAKTAVGTDVKTNTVPHNDFQNNINNYLKGSPDDVFTWFAGFRMKAYAKQGLVEPIDDVWQTIGSNFPDSFAKASTGDDGKKYFVPLYNYPWAVFYRPSVFTKYGYATPTTLDQFVALSKQMQKDQLTPIALADQDGWPAFGTFDYLNMRQNGYRYHMDLMAHKVSWEDPKTKAAFDTWKSLLPYHAGGALGRTWQEAAQTVIKKTSGTV